MIDLNDITTFKIILNKQCNMNCIYCLQGTKYDIIKNDPMSPEELSVYFPENKSYNVVYFGGEPFLSFDFFIKLTDIIKKKNNKAIFSVVTNGSLITKEKVDEINKRKIRVTISHDAVAQKITRDKTDILETNGEINFLEFGEHTTTGNIISPIIYQTTSQLNLLKISKWIL